MSVLLAGRFLHGLTLNSFSISKPWIGRHLEADARPKALAQAQAAVALGIMVGPAIGIGVASLAPNAMVGYVNVGWLTISLSLFQLWITRRGFEDETILGASGDDVDEATAKRDAELVASPYYDTAQVVAAVCVLSDFLRCAAFLAGFESTLTLSVWYAYGWSLAESMLAWVPMALFGLAIGAFVAPKLIDNFNPAKVCFFSVLFSCGSLLGVNWLDFSEPVPSWWFVLVGIFGNGSNVTVTLLMGIVSQHLPARQQITFAAVSGIAGQFGRTLGPILATFVFQSAEEATDGSKGAGANASRVYMLGLGTAPVAVILACNFRRFFGSFSDPSPREKREKKTKAAASFELL